MRKEGSPSEEPGQSLDNEAIRQPVENHVQNLSEEEKILSPQDVMKAAVARYNKIQEQVDIPWRVLATDSTRFDFQLTDTGANNQLAVAAINTKKDPVTGNEAGTTSFVHVGHFDPGEQRFLFYPELLADYEAEVVEQLAKNKRAQAVQEHPEYDFDAEVIRDLHKKHREVLLDDSLIQKIAARYNDLPDKEKLAGISEYLIDDRTSMHVCLTPKLGGYKKSDVSSVQAENLFMTDEAFVSIALYGDLLQHDGVLRRKVSNFIHVGYRDLDDPNGRLKPDRRLVTDDEFAKIATLATELQHLKSTSLPNLDTEMVALKRENPHDK